MKNKKFSMQLGIGTPSMIMIFVIVVMCIISVLSYLDASSYYTSCYQQAHHMMEYYEGQSQGLKLYYQLNSTMEDREIRELLKEEKVDYEMNENMIRYQYDINDHQYILFEINRDDLSIETIRQCNKVE